MWIFWASCNVFYGSIWKDTGDTQTQGLMSRILKDVEYCIGIFLRDLLDSGSCRLFAAWFYGSWISQIVLLWDPLNLGSCIRAMLWDPRYLGSCRAVLPSDPVDLGFCFLVTTRVWRPCGWDKASRNSKLRQSLFISHTLHLAVPTVLGKYIGRSEPCRVHSLR